MFGPFKASQPLLGGLLWKIPWRLSAPRKQRQRKRLKAVDNVISQLNLGLYMKKALEEDPSKTFKDVFTKKKVVVNDVGVLKQLNDPSIFPSEAQMSSKDKYTVFSKHSRGYRKGIHKVPKWTKVSHRVNPDNF
ncbi:HFL069Cp [Eremothecium sinecaudum]|uniref:HFL069Cp n=1 Tax=Eremothecium sinecaudum TaxID=45286 RepID=A0A0X8HUI1_9SACH|nr:HFL069Cp [Eremothecium sinecaudum]AMD21787.1 HFL069Cp [Eremothecium sinecaudum]